VHTYSEPMCLASGSSFADMAGCAERAPGAARWSNDESWRATSRMRVRCPMRATMVVRRPRRERHQQGDGSLSVVLERREGGRGLTRRSTTSPPLAMLPSQPAHCGSPLFADLPHFVGWLSPAKHKPNRRTVMVSPKPRRVVNRPDPLNPSTAETQVGRLTFPGFG